MEDKNLLLLLKSDATPLAQVGTIYNESPGFKLQNLTRKRRKRNKKKTVFRTSHALLALEIGRAHCPDI